MSGIDPTSNPIHELWNRLTGPANNSNPSAAEAAATPKTPAERDVAYQDALDRLPQTATAAPVTLGNGNTARALLDAYQASTKGPYQVDGKTVLAPAQFRMTEGFNRDAAFGKSTGARAVQARLNDVAAKAGLTEQVQDLRYGRGTPEGLVRVTQALIDADKVSFKPNEDPAAGIQALQWKYGIGMDCAGYVYGAIAAVHGNPTALGLKSHGNEDFRGLPQNPRFTSVDPTVARAGDVMVLAGNGTNGNPGHNLMVYSHTLMTDAGAATLHGQWPKNAAADEFFGAADANGVTDTIHKYEVDTSFSAGADGTAQGGVRRDTLLYNERSGAWAMLRSTTPPTFDKRAVPYNEPALTGIFRPTVVR